MESQDLSKECEDKECKDFFKRFLLQGKLISQIVTFWWTYGDEGDESDEGKAAYTLGKCFFPGFRNADPAIGDPNLRNLFSANPGQYFKNIENKSPNPYTDTDKDPLRRHVDALITVFGKDRITKNSEYLSPIFSDTELGFKRENNLPYYQFKIDTSGTKFGRLTDPEIVIEKGNSLLKYIYTIPIPPRHLSPLIQRHKDIYKEWINDNDENNKYPPSPHIPFTT
ncbi:hypothetical protein H6G27_32340 [Nostoc linckia FACHB-104]|nr:hypothetical protein [Nostoc linckia FACHB-104]